MYTLKNIITVSALLSFVLVLNACVVPSGPHGHYPPSYSHSAMVYWYYYPNYQAYYHPTDHYYYYSIGGVWRRSTSLPSGWVLRDEPRVRLELSGVPHQHHSNHRRLYPPKRPFNTAPGRPGNENRHDNQRRPENDDRHGSDNSHQHRPDRDRKEGGNMFIPHTKEKRVYDKRQKIQKNGQAGTSNIKKSDEKKYSENQKTGSSANNVKQQGKQQVKKQKQKSSGKAKGYEKGKSGYDDDYNDKRSREQNVKDMDDRKQLYQKR